MPAVPTMRVTRKGAKNDEPRTINVSDFDPEKHVEVKAATTEKAAEKQAEKPTEGDKK